jgi:predicted lipid-binding transport protein (Tim44 family)
MNQRVPQSGGLPLRAMVMVLLFLAVVFLLLGLRAVFSDGDSSSQSNASTTSATSANTASSPATSVAGPKSPVFVYNVSTVTGLAASTAQQLKDAGWNAEAKQDSLDPAPAVTGVTVYFTDAPGEKSSAEEVAKLLKAPAPQERVPELKELQPGVIVIVTG